MRPLRLLAVVSGSPRLLAARPQAAAPSVGLSGAGGTAPAPDRPRPRARLRAWAELLRVSALFSVPGDALAGAAAVGLRPGRGTALAVGASLCLYEAGMALNDWADREEDAVDRPHRPIPSGRIAPGAALAAAGALTAAGLTLAARAGRPALAVATGLGATVWAYDLHLKHTRLGPAAMGTARALDLLLGAVATTAPAAPATATAAGRGREAPAVQTRGARTAGTAFGTRGARAAGTARGARTAGTAFGTRRARTVRPMLGARAALPAALALGAHTYAVTAVSRHEAQGGSTKVPLAALAGTAALGAAVLRGRPVTAAAPPAVAPPTSVAAPPTATSPTSVAAPASVTWPASVGALASVAWPARATSPAPAAERLLLTAFTGAYLRTSAVPLLHAALNPSPPLTQRAVGGGIRAMIPLQAALAARAGSPLGGLAVMGLVPLARALARKVSPT
ncbi:UbiA family prenyltransferase [Streptomyces sp. NPDC005494]|uniref:UbiA family prenyltransferase n=1 Tax=Streptomyces sp. NPDC005494 TaxID=3364715 RepID=UPI00369DA94D